VLGLILNHLALNGTDKFETHFLGNLQT
jgi:hypothetical protein